jgi:hypothetical protein
MLDDVVGLLQGRYGDDWTKNDEANLRFTIEVEQVLRDLDGVHLIGGPELDDAGITLTVWVDDPIHDLMGADQLAYDVFGRISEEIFFAERRFERKGVRYPFVTGSDEHGHVGSLVLTGPHVTDFAERNQLRVSGDVRFQA